MMRFFPFVPNSGQILAIFSFEVEFSARQQATFSNQPQKAFCIKFAVNYYIFALGLHYLSAYTFEPRMKGSHFPPFVNVHSILHPFSHTYLAFVPCDSRH